MKFAALSDSLRSMTDIYQDAHDFMRLVLVNAGINLGKLSRLGDLIHSSGGRDLLEMVRKVRAGEKLIL